MPPASQCAAVGFLLLILFVSVDCAVKNVATDWSTLLASTICKAGTAFNEATSELASLHVVQWQSLVSLYGSGKKAAASQESVVAHASHYVFTTFYPSEFVAADLLLKSHLAGEDVYESNQAREYAHSVASFLLRSRIHSGREYALGSLKVPTSKQGIPGEFVLDDPPQDYYYPIPSPLFAQVALSQTYIIPDVEMYRLAFLKNLAPPTLSSSQFKTDLAEIKEFGSKTSSKRTADQTFAARFWLSTGPDKGAICSVSDFYTAAAIATIPKTTSLYDTVTILAKTTVAIFDATVLAAHLQYSFRFWRPATAIRTGFGSVAGDKSWTPLLPTPNHPEWPSVTVSEAAAGAAVLAALVGDNIPFSVTGGVGPAMSGPGLGPRSFKSFTASYKDAADARVFAGAHFRGSTNAAVLLGKSVAKWVLDNWEKRVPSGVLPEMQHLFWFSGRISTVGKPNPVQIFVPESGSKFYQPFPV